ncbi:coiled-coil alpha-helical rod protein 1 [Bufo bufo]|uniref:coiled-coil alpha-helical rod protein 1 n=1 Tax=Bufo bufo TaxID=8384 RepID=UPI001ABEC730|nr:coiled-coil alpha-helical rod protein 1 [Bufo bufo]
MEKRTLNPPPVFLTSRGQGVTGLIPPSHFEARRQRPAPPLPSPVPPSTEAELLTELTKLKEENEVLKKRQEKGEGARARSLDRYLPEVPPSESKALEIIAHQMREIQKLEKVVAVAQEKEEERLRLAQEMEALKRACREAEQEEERRRQEEERKRQAKEAAEIEKLQKLQLLTESHKMESDELKIRVHALESQLREEREEKILEVKHLREELQVTTEKRAALEADFSRSHSELESQKTLVLQLRTYIGELVPDRQVEEQKREKTELKNTIQLLQKERDALQTSMSLLQTRLSSLTHILSLQESDLCKKADKHLGGQKTQQLLKLWREKVFSLMVQLKSEDINQENDSRKIQDKICSLENSLQESSQQLAIYSHAMQDRTAELEMERVRNKCLQDKLTAAQATATSLSSRAEKAEQTVLKLKQMIDSFAQAFYKQENSFRGALQQLVTLGQRVTFATKRVDTIQGLVAQRLALTKLRREEEQAGNTATEDDICRPSYEDLMAEVSLLNEERDRLSAELKRSALIIEGRVTQTREKLEAEIEACHHTASLLRSSLHETEERERVLREQVVDLERRLQEACETSTQLQEQLRDQKEEYEKELQDKVRAIEENTTQQMAQMEKHLHEARREHTKAVVALRQTERQIQREKTRSQETTSTIEDAARVREEQLVRQLRDAERDKNLMMATLRQEGLFASYQKTRMSAVQSIEIVNENVQRPAEDARARCTPAVKDSISNMVANLQSLGASVLADEEDDDEEDFSH